MDITFNDERINSQKSLALRETMLFTLGFTTIYIIVYLLGALAADKTSLTPLITAIGTWGVTSLLIAFGELAHIGAKSDEMIAFKKTNYYNKAFFWMIFSSVLIYCFEVAINTPNAGEDPSALPQLEPNTFINAAIAAGFIFLIIRMRARNVTLNYSVIEEPNAVYYRKVTVNIIKFFGLCAVFTTVASMIYIFTNIGRVSDMGTAMDIIYIQFAGGFSFFTLSLDYLLLSVTEKSSLAAREKGRVSPATLILFCICFAVSAISEFVALAVSAKLGPNASLGIMIISYVNLFVNELTVVMLPLAMLYFKEELKWLASDLLEKACNIYAILALVNLCINKINIIVMSALAAQEKIHGSFETQKLFMLRANIMNAVSLLAFTINILCFIFILYALSKNYKNLFPFIPVIAAISAIKFITQILVSANIRTEFRMAYYVINCIFSIIMIIWIVSVYKNVSEELE